MRPVASLAAAAMLVQWLAGAGVGHADGQPDFRAEEATGDLVSELYVEVMDLSGESGTAQIGGTLVLSGAGEIQIHIRAKDPGGPNHCGDSPEVPDCWRCNRAE